MQPSHLLPVTAAIILAVAVCGTCGNEQLSSGNDTDHGHGGVHVVSWNYAYVRQPLLTSCFIMAASLLKLGFHKAHWLSSVIPESCLLIIVGIAFGAVLEATGESEVFNLDPRTFMLYLLPPIILDSAYSLVDRVFAENIGTILLFAVLGSVSCCFMLGPTLYGLAVGGGMHLDITLTECLLFASFIIAVDPVAVLAIFQEVGVNNTLYFLVFGESLLNDAVTVVLSNMMKAFVEMDEIPPSQIAIGIASFFTISLGGLFIGICFGILTSLITRTTKDVRIIEPLAVIMLAYLSYIFAELFHWSGIISIIGCGMVQAQYAFHNISRKSHTTVIYFVKMTSANCDCMIFLFLGLEVLRNKHEWNTGFVLWSTFYCLVFRFLITFGFSFLVNLMKPTKKISFEDQFIMWYGGLRGAVCFALCDTLNPEFRHKNMFLTTTFFIIGLTVFVQGITIKPLVKLCRVKTKHKDDVTIMEEINERVMDHVMTGIEVITQQKGTYFVRSWLLNINDLYLSRWLQNDPMSQDEKILKAYGYMAMADYEDVIATKFVNPKQADMWSKFYHDTPSDRNSTRPYSQTDGESLMRKRTISRGTRGSSRRKSISDVIMGRHSVNMEEPTAEDVHTLLKYESRPTSVMHHRYDPTLSRDDERDLLKQLEEHHRRVKRLRRSLHGTAAATGARGAQHGPGVKPTTKPKPKEKKPPFRQQSSIHEQGDCISLEDVSFEDPRATNGGYGRHSAEIQSKESTF